MATPTSSTSSSGRNPRSRTVSRPTVSPPYYETSTAPSPFPRSSSSTTVHPLRHSATVPAQSTPSSGLRTNVLRSRTTAGSGFVDPSSREVEAKVVLLGSTAVGKTSLIWRYCKREWKHGTEGTISANISTRKNFVDGVKVKLQIWDTAGGERFRAMAELYYRHANVALLLYDVTNRSSFHDLQDWFREIREKTQSDTIIHFVGSKSDLKATAGEEVVDLAYARSHIRSWMYPEPSPPPIESPPMPAPLIRPTVPSPASSRFGFSVSSRPQVAPPATTTPSQIALPHAEVPTFARTHTGSSSTYSQRERRQSGDWAGAVAQESLLRPTHERRGSRRKSEEWGRTTPTTSDGLDGSDRGSSSGFERRRTGGSVTFAREERERNRWGGLAVEDGEDGIRVWECSSLKNEGIEELFAYVNYQLMQHGDRIQKEKERRDRESVNLSADIPMSTKSSSSKSAAACCSV